jgi:hypothetical protein
MQSFHRALLALSAAVALSAAADASFDVSKCDAALCMDEGTATSGRRWSMTTSQTRCEALRAEGVPCTWGTWGDQTECRAAVCAAKHGERCAKMAGMNYVCSNNEKEEVRRVSERRQSSPTHTHHGA